MKYTRLMKYYCKKCKIFHRYNSKRGEEHFKFARTPEEMLKTKKEEWLKKYRGVSCQVLIGQFWVRGVALDIGIKNGETKIKIDSPYGTHWYHNSLVMF